jgi:hypothetical protein
LPSVIISRNGSRQSGPSGQERVDWHGSFTGLACGGRLGHLS